MTHAPLQFSLREWMNSIVPTVFATMVSLEARPTPPTSHPRSGVGERVSGAIGIAGESLTGAVYLHLSLAFATEVAALMLGAAPRPADVNDVVGELCNMIGGKLKSLLADHGAPCAMSPPSIIRGASFAIESMPDARLETYRFDCLTYQLAVEIHLQSQDL